MKRTTFALGALLGLVLATPALGESCDLSDLRCSRDGKKCNIKIINDTGSKTGSDGGSGYNQYSRAATIKVQARKDDGTKAGKNTLEILDQQSKTINLGKKHNFADVKIWPTTTTEKGRAGVVLQCEDIRNVLREGKNCHVFMTRVMKRSNTSTDYYFYLAYNCGGKDVAAGQAENHAMFKPFK